MSPATRTTPDLATATKSASDYIYRLSASVHRAESGTLTGRNSNQTTSAAEWNFEHALTLIVSIEDTYGVDAAAKLTDRLTRWRQRAVAARLLTPAQVLRIEAAACAPDTHRVAHGWSRYQDFTNEADAREYAEDLAKQPMRDPLCRRVELLDLTQPAPYPRLAEWERPAERPLNELAADINASCHPIR